MGRILTLPIVAVMLFYFRKDALNKILGIAVAMLSPFLIYMLLKVFWVLLQDYKALP